MAASAFEQTLEKYAEVAVRVGLNLQPGQRLLIGGPDEYLTPLEAAPLVRLIAAKAYQAGARLVDVLWGDDRLKQIRLRNAPGDSFEESSAWQVSTPLEYLQRGDAFLRIYAPDPDLFREDDPELLGRIEQIGARRAAPISEYLSRNAGNWLVITSPVPGWAAKLFPEEPPEEREVRLWNVLFEICRVKSENPIVEWQEHIRRLVARSSDLTAKQYTALRLVGPGTHLTIGLPPGHVWRSAGLTSAAGIPFAANIPTEEVFTSPHRERTEGVVTSTKPLNIGGTLIREFSLSFSRGRVVKITAEKGEGTLRQQIETDEGAGRLGEVALVPNSSPISETRLTFYNVLIDENASSHVALGRGFRFSVQGGEKMTDSEFALTGINVSAIHRDFMIGSGEMDVDGVRNDGSVEAIMRSGEWTNRV